jgi:hypothetical protein
MNTKRRGESQKSESRKQKFGKRRFPISAFGFLVLTALCGSVVIPGFLAPRRLGGDSLHHGDTEGAEKSGRAAPSLARSASGTAKYAKYAKRGPTAKGRTERRKTKSGRQKTGICHAGISAFNFQLSDCAEGEWGARPSRSLPAEFPRRDLRFRIPDFNFLLFTDAIGTDAG